jgi:hypothetical protein
VEIAMSASIPRKKVSLRQRGIGEKTIKQTFVKVSHAIFQTLWQWAKRRHPHKPLGWIKNKYFTTIGGDQWVFHGTVKAKNGETRTVYLLKASKVPIKRHIKIKGEANPYDPAWEEYLCAVSSATRSATNVAKSLGIFCTHRA